MKCIVKLIWDDDIWRSEVFTESAQDVCLVLEFGSCDALIERVKIALPEMLALNFGYVGDVQLSFEIERKDHIKARKSIQEIFNGYDGGCLDSEELDWGAPQGDEVW